MKRIVVLLLFIFAAVPAVFADDANSNHNYQYLNRSSAGGIHLVGYVDNYWTISIDPILNGSHDPYIGMPFDLQGSDVKYHSSNIHLGRTIGHWSLVVNIDSGAWEVDVSATPLVLDSTSINYYLVFVVDESRNKYISVYSDGMTYSYPDDQAEARESVSLLDKQIRVMLDDYDDETRASWPVTANKNYEATVTITLVRND